MLEDLRCPVALHFEQLMEVFEMVRNTSLVPRLAVGALLCFSIFFEQVPGGEFQGSQALLEAGDDLVCGKNVERGEAESDVDRLHVLRRRRPSLTGQPSQFVAS